MAALKHLLLSQARRQGLTKPFSSPFQQIPRLLSSDSNESRSPPVSSYDEKSEPTKAEENLGGTSESAKQQEEGRSRWKREEIRYKLVSYAQHAVIEDEGKERTQEEMEREWKRIDSENLAFKRHLRARPNALEEEGTSLYYEEEDEEEEDTLLVGFVI